jgi:hypothetical protein
MEANHLDDTPRFVLFADGIYRHQTASPDSKGVIFLAAQFLHSSILAAADYEIVPMPAFL